MVNYVEVRIHREAFMFDMLLPARLDQFLGNNNGWTKHEDICSMDIIIQFSLPETFKQFHIKFAKSDKSIHVMTKQEVLKDVVE